MYDRTLALDILQNIKWSTQTVIDRFEPVESSDDFTSSAFGMEKMDAICMQLIAIGEGLKNLDKVTENTLLPRYPQIAWKKVMGTRDMISHHYYKINASTIFETCDLHIEPLLRVIEAMIKEVERAEHTQ